MGNTCQYFRYRKFNEEEVNFDQEKKQEEEKEQNEIRKKK